MLWVVVTSNYQVNVEVFLKVIKSCKKFFFSVKVKIIPKPQMQMISNLSMDIFRSQDRSSSMLIEEGDGESMKDTVSVSGVEMGAAEAKAKEAAEENEKEAEKEEVKVDLSKAEEAEETV